MVGEAPARVHRALRDAGSIIARIVLPSSASRHCVLQVRSLGDAEAAPPPEAMPSNSDHDSDCTSIASHEEGDAPHCAITPQLEGRTGSPSARPADRHNEVERWG